MAKVRCGGCKQYFDKNEMTKVSIQNFCSGCFSPFGASIAPQSEKRLSERDERIKVVDAARKRDGGCMGPSRGLPGKCWELLDGNEIIPRSQLPGGHLVLDNIVTLCRFHHTMITDDPKLGYDTGLSKHFYE